MIVAERDRGIAAVGDEPARGGDPRGPRVWRTLCRAGAGGSVPGVFPGGVACRAPGLPLALLEDFAASVALNVHLEDGGVVDQAVDGGHRGGFVG